MNPTAAGPLEWQPPQQLWPEISASPHAGLVELALRATASAGRLLVAGQGVTLEVTTKTTATDVVTQMDTAAEAEIRRVLLGDRPEDTILGEEGGEVGSGAGVRWVVDPLDGTVNYLYGNPAWAVSIAAEVAGEVVLGVVAVPRLAETYVAVRGGGSYLCRGSDPGSRLTIAAGPDLGSALVATGFGYAAARRAAQAATLARVLPAVRDIRRVGAASVDLCWLAAGRVDAYYERGLHPWDYAAGALVAREAGAVIGGPPASPEAPSTELTWGAGPALAQRFHELILAAGADRDLS
jgi:myo-inositol-1(or 4)-monophosphatase